MKHEIMIFVSTEFGQIRTIEETGRVLFCGSDAAKALGYRNPRKALTDHCKEKGVTKRDSLTNGGIQALTYIDEGNLYRLIAHSRLPSAERFESWIFDEVLPTIRRTGGYVSNDELFTDTYLPFADEETKALFKLQLMTIRQLNARIEHDQPLVKFAEHVAASRHYGGYPSPDAGQGCKENIWLQQTVSSSDLSEQCNGCAKQNDTRCHLF